MTVRRLKTPHLEFKTGKDLARAEAIRIIKKGTVEVVLATEPVGKSFREALEAAGIVCRDSIPTYLFPRPKKWSKR